MDSDSTLGRKFRVVAEQGVLYGIGSVVGRLAGIVLIQLPRMQMEGLTFQLVIWGALTATLVEFLSFKIDDNITVPVITSLVMKIISG